MMITKILGMYLRNWSDTGGRDLCIHFESDRPASALSQSLGHTIRRGWITCDAEKASKNEQMQALLARGQREGIALVEETHRLWPAKNNR